MATNDIGSLGVVLTANINQFKDALDKAKKETNSFSDVLTKKFGGVGDSFTSLAKSFDPIKLAVGGLSGVIAGFALNTLVDMGKGVISAQSELYKLSKQTNISVESLSALKGIAALSGTSLDDIASMTSKFERSMASAERPTSQQAKAFATLGVSLKDGSGHFKDITTLQQEAAASLLEHASGVEADNVIMALWGKTAVKNKQFLDDLAVAGELHGKVTTEQGNRADDLVRSMLKLEKAAGQVKREMVASLIPTLLDLSKELLAATKAADGFWAGLWHTTADKITGNNVENTTAALEKLRAKREQIASQTVGDSKEEQEAAKKTLAMTDTAIARMEKEVEYQKKKAGAVADAAKVEEKLANAHKGPTLANVGSGEIDPNKYNKDKAYLSEVVKYAEAASKATSELNNQFETNLTKLNSAVAAGKFEEYTQAQVDSLREKAAALDLIESKVRYKQEDIKLEDDYAKALDQVNHILTTRVSLFDKDTANGKNKKYSEEDLALLREKTIALDKIEKLSRTTQLNDQQELQLQGLEKEIAKRNIATDVLKTYGATALEVQLAQDAVAISLDEQTLAQIRATNADDKRIEAMEKQIETSKKMLSINSDQLARDREDRDYQRSFSTGWDNAFNTYRDSATNNAEKARGVFASVSTNMEDQIVAFATTGTASFSSFANAVISDISRIIAKETASKIIGNATGLFSGLFNSPSTASSLGSGISGSLASVFPSANGNVFNGHITPFANGGVLTGPTYFPMQNGIGVGGEAGTEAIMPLARNANGKLGVVASGNSNSGTSTVNSYQINVTLTGAQATEENGQMIGTEVMKAIANQQIAAANRVGGMNNSMRIGG